MRSLPPRDVQAVWRKYGHELDVYLSQMLLAKITSKKKKLQVFDVEFSKGGAQEKPLLGKTYKTSLLLGWSWEVWVRRLCSREC